MSRTQPSPEAIRRLAYEISDMKTSNALRVKLLSPKGKLPVKGTNLATGYDLSSAQQLVIPVNGRALVQTDISISAPKGTYRRIAPRSGLAVKYGITMGVGVLPCFWRRSDSSYIRLPIVFPFISPCIPSLSFTFHHVPSHSIALSAQFHPISSHYLCSP